MKTLAVFRHAKAEPGDSHLPDFERDLNERGRREAELVGRTLRERGFGFDLALTSPAVRTVQTLLFAERALGQTLRISHDQRIYEADADGLQDIIREIDDGADSVLLVGHNPAFQQLVLALAQRDERGFRDRVEAKFPPAGLATIRLPIGSWKDAAPATGEIVELILPEELSD